MTDLSEKTENVTQLQDEANHIEDEIHRIKNKLANEGFISRVPAAMIEKEQKKLSGLEQQQKKVKAQLAEITEH